MKIGFTYDLRDDYLALGFTLEETAEMDKPDTIRAIENVLNDLGHQVDKIGNVKALVSRLSNGEKWDLVFNIAEGLYGFGREAQIPALLEAYKIPYTFSDPLVLSLTLHKGMTKHVIKNLGIRTPDFAVVQCESDIATVNLAYPLFAKPVAEGTGKGITPQSKIGSGKELASVCRHLLAMYHQPVLVETFLPGREFTVGIVGTGEEAESVGVMEILLNSKAEKEIYSYENKANYEDLVDYALITDEWAKKAEAVALSAWKGLSCRDAGRVDVRADKNGDMHFLEVNPLAGLHPVHSDLPIICGMNNISFSELIRRILEQASKRISPA